MPRTPAPDPADTPEAAAGRPARRRRAPRRSTYGTVRGTWRAPEAGADMLADYAYRCS